MFNTKIKSILDLIDENAFIISDTHFNHEHILTFEPGRMTQMLLDGYNDHNEWLIDRWNSIVGPDDIVLHLGDFAFKGLDIQTRLNGRKILILGNHDRKGTNTYTSFEYVIRGLVQQHDNFYSIAETTDELTSILIKNINDKKIMFSHYPVCESEIRWIKNKENDEVREHPLVSRLLTGISLYNANNCDMNIHGHTHSHCMTDRDNRVFKNASVENIGMQPIRIKELIK